MAEPLEPKYDGPRKGSMATAIEEAQFREVISLILSGVGTKKALASRAGVNIKKIETICADPRFRELMAAEAERFYGDAIDVIRDTKLAPVLREMALRNQAFMAAAEAVEAARDAVRAGNRQSAMLRMMVDAYATIHDRSPGFRDKQEQQHVHIHAFMPNAEQARAMREAEVEAGIDISDVLNVTPIQEDSYATQREDQADRGEPAEGTEEQRSGGHSDSLALPPASTGWLGGLDSLEQPARATDAGPEGPTRGLSLRLLRESQESGE